jgi:hypothetical protein
MSQNGAQVQELAIHLSQHISNAFGAAYCRVALAPGGAKFFNANGAEPETLELALPQLRAAENAQKMNGAPGFREPKLTEPFTPGVEAQARISAAGQSAQSRLRFCWAANEAHNEQGCLEIFFPGPRRFSPAQISALLLTAELARMLLLFARAASVRTSSAEQVVKKMQSDVFAMPFLEAKKLWIDAFEQEYLRQQMIKFFGNISKAARAARISRYTLYALLNKFQFSAQSFKRMKPQKSSLGRNATHNGRKKSEAQEAVRDMFAQLS